MTRDPANEISLTRALAILAATFAIVFASLLPSAVAASAASDAPVRLCSGEMVRMAFDAHGQPVPVEGDQQASLTCAMALLSGLQAVDTPPVALPAQPETVAAPTFTPASTAATRTALYAPKPPATAPPHA